MGMWTLREIIIPGRRAVEWAAIHSTNTPAADWLMNIPQADYRSRSSPAVRWCCTAVAFPRLMRGHTE
jgi:hypothetical protein